MPLASNALCTVADVRLFRQIESSETDQDSITEDLINSASRAILNYCKREFAPTSTAITRTFAYEGLGILSLSPYDLRSVTSLTVDSVANTTYKLRPLPAIDGVYNYILIDCQGSEVAITGNWGWTSIPVDVNLACKSTVAYWIARDVQAFSRTFHADAGTVEGGEALPSGVRGLLNHYRSRVMA